HRRDGGGRRHFRLPRRLGHVAVPGRDPDRLRLARVADFGRRTRAEGVMTEDPAELARRAAYLDTLRAQGRTVRTVGFIASLVGVLILVIGRFRLGGAIWLLWTGVAVIGFGWSCFVYALIRRLTWIRTHPYVPNAPGASGPGAS